jgi:hypothetical protein
MNVEAMKEIPLKVSGSTKKRNDATRNGIHAHTLATGYTLSVTTIPTTRRTPDHIAKDDGSAEKYPPNNKATLSPKGNSSHEWTTARERGVARFQIRKSVMLGTVVRSKGNLRGLKTAIQPTQAMVKMKEQRCVANKSISSRLILRVDRTEIGERHECARPSATNTSGIEKQYDKKPQ